jgi:CheY-like chemotaxis protein
LEPDAGFVVRQRGDLVAILGKNGTAFPALKDVERTQKYLKAKMPELFHETAIAFYETSDHEAGIRLQPSDEVAQIEPVTASDLWVTRGKHGLILVRDASERQALHDLLCDLDMVVILADSGVKGLQLLEDMEMDLLLMDVQLPDMHGWELLAKLKEIGSFQTLPKIVLADYHSKSDDQAFALTVGKVDLYLPRPISLVLLRQNIWNTFKQKVD